MSFVLFFAYLPVIGLLFLLLSRRAASYATFALVWGTFLYFVGRRLIEGRHPPP